MPNDMIIPQPQLHQLRGGHAPELGSFHPTEAIEPTAATPTQSDSVLTSMPSPTRIVTTSTSTSEAHPGSQGRLGLRADTTSVLIQTVTSGGVVYVTSVTLGGDYHPTDVATPPPEKHLTNAEVGGIAGGVGALVLILALGFWVYLKRKNDPKRHMVEYYYESEYGTESSGSLGEAGFGPGGPGGPRIRVNHHHVSGPPPMAQPVPGPPPVPELNVSTAQWQNPYAGAQNQRYFADPRVKRSRT